MNHVLPKQYHKLGHQTVVEHSLEVFANQPLIESVVVVVAANDPYWPAIKREIKQDVQTVVGATQRCQSVFNGLKFLSDRAGAQDWILVHDAARPCLRTADLRKLMRTALERQQGCILATPVADTIKQDDGHCSITATIDRAHLWRALTPQMFPFHALKSALAAAITSCTAITDEAEAMEKSGVRTHLVQGHADNIKITQAADMLLAEAILNQQGRLLCA